MSRGSICTRAQLRNEYLDAKQGTWDPHKDIKVEIEFDKMMTSGGPGQEGFAETPGQGLQGVVLRSDVELLFSFLYSWDVLLCISYVLPDCY